MTAAARVPLWVTESRYNCIALARVMLAKLLELCVLICELRGAGGSSEAGVCLPCWRYCRICK